MSENVVEFADWKVRKEYRRYSGDQTKCSHKNLTMDPNGFTVQCDDCKLQLAAYWVLERMLDQYRDATKRLAAEREMHQQKVMGEARLLAVKQVEKAWRSRRMVPSCPHCTRGIFPADGLGGSMVSKEMEMARREREPDKRWGARSASVVRAFEAADKGMKDAE